MQFLVAEEFRYILHAEHGENCMIVRYLSGSHFPEAVGCGCDVRGLTIRTPVEVEIVVDL